MSPLDGNFKALSDKLSKWVSEKKIKTVADNIFQGVQIVSDQFD